MGRRSFCMKETIDRMDGSQAGTRLTCLQDTKTSVAREMSEEEKETLEMTSDMTLKHIGESR